jgi:hypothetical protein
MKVINLSNLLTTLCITQTCLYARPPKAPSQPVTETYFGKQVTPPYRNLENLQDPVVQQASAYQESEVKIRQQAANKTIFFSLHS